MEPLTEYYAVVEYSGGNGTHHIEARASLEGSSITYDGATWTTVPDVGIIGRLNVGLPPIASYGCIHNRNAWIFGDPDNEGEVYYTRNTQYDWGRLGVMDVGKSSYKIGGIQSVYNALYIYGQEDTPYICTLTGANEDEFSLPPLYQRQWTLPLTLVPTINDLWSGNNDGVDSFMGVQEYGDVRTFSESDPVEDLIKKWWGDSAFAGYAPEKGQYMLHLPGYDNTLVCHTKLPTQDVDGRTRYPWTEMSTPFTPTTFGNMRGKFVAGASDGYLYVFDEESVFEYTGDRVDPIVQFKYTQFFFRGSYVHDLQFIMDSLTGGAFDITFYKDGNLVNEVYTWRKSLPVHDDIIIADLGSLIIADAEFALGPAAPIEQNLDFIARSIMAKLHNFSLAGTPMYIDGLVIRHRPLEE